LDQQLGPEYENGVDLSGGQWQSLAIARTYAKKAPIVILDEPTSAIDVKSEMDIFDRLNKKMRNETLIFISHRFTTIKDAERIIVLEKGKIVEDGSHNDLMKKPNSKYAQLYNIQADRLHRD
jgi:ATP-binding cassette subfamily B protein